MKCSGDLWRRKHSQTAADFLFFPLSLSPSMEMINGIAHKVNSTRDIAFYLWWTYLSPVVVNLSSWDPVRRQRRRVQTPPSLPRPGAKVLTSKSWSLFFPHFSAPQKSLLILWKMKSKAHCQGKGETQKMCSILNMRLWKRCSSCRQRPVDDKVTVCLTSWDSFSRKKEINKSRMTSLGMRQILSTYSLL